MLLRSRTFTPAFRFFAGMTVFSLLAAFVLGFSSEVQSPMDRILGPLTLGWKGGIGNHLGYTFFVGLAALSGGLAGILVAFRDADPEAEAEVAHVDTVPLTRAPAGVNYLPALAALGAVLAIVGLGSGAGYLSVSGLVLAVAVAFVWTLRAWAERATGDDEVNTELYHRFVDPLRTPVVAVVCIALVVIGLSRVLLAVSKTGSVIVFGVAATLFFAVATVLALYPKSTRIITTLVVVIGALIIVIAGVIGAVQGERDIEHHDEGGTEGTEVTTEGAAAPAPSFSFTAPGLVDLT